VFALAWFAAVIGVFWLSASKLATYVLPAFPAAAFLIADYWCQALRPRSRGERIPSGPLAIAVAGAAISTAAAGAILVSAQSGRFTLAEPVAYGLAAVLVAAALAASAAVLFGRLAIFATVQAVSTVGFVLVFVVFGWPGLEASESTRTLVQRLEAGGLAAQIAGAYRVPDVSLDFYLGRALARETDAGGLARRVWSDPGRLWVVRADEVESLAAQHPLNLVRVMTVSRRAVVRLSPPGPGDGRKDGM
jgi:4-amino-4-deoxy-L-arabinose transferase-like glycosyltransferase